MLEGLSGDGRLSFYARDLTRLVAWLRTQPRSRVLVLGALGVGLVVGAVLLSTRREQPAAGAGGRFQRGVDRGEFRS